MLILENIGWLGWEKGIPYQCPEGHAEIFGYVSTLDLHFSPGGLPSHVSQGLAPTFLRSTYPWGGGWNSSYAGSISPYGVNSVQLLRAWLSSKTWVLKKNESETFFLKLHSLRIEFVVDAIWMNHSFRSFVQEQIEYEWVCNIVLLAIVSSSRDWQNVSCILGVRL